MQVAVTRWLMLLGLLTVWLSPVALASATPQKSDVRVLIDISGSMRQNDPNNLRRPALRLLAGLLQPGTRAGVWTFARWVNNLVPVAEVDAGWKQRVQSLSEQINSPGQFTNIEDVLDKASRDWSGEPTSHARHLVLLTDGMVDISKQAADNAQSRSRILQRLLPWLQAAGVRLHTIALSARADHELMQRLAGETGGSYHQVGEAAELQRVFLRMFETVAKPDSVPLQDNKFVVDRSINEATVLLFSKQGSTPVELYSPSGEMFSGSNLPAGVAWFRDQGYDLITVSDPEKGEWRLRADADPDNRVMIVTDLKLQTSEVPSQMAVGDAINIEAFLSNQGKVVARQAFLSLLQLWAEAFTSDDHQALDLNDAAQGVDKSAGDGRYSTRYLATAASDAVGLSVAVDSPTFMRERRFTIAVQEPLQAQIEETADGPVLVLGVPVAVMQSGATAEAWQPAAAEQRVPLKLQPDGESKWLVPLSDPMSPVFARLTGTSRLGTSIDYQVGPLYPPGLAEPEPVAEPTLPEPRPVAESAPEPVSEEPAQPPTPADSQEPKEENWLVPAIIFGATNLILLVGGAVWWFLHRRRAAGGEVIALDSMLPENTTAAAQKDAA